jgi:cation diffusion facilitator CzcD-associated flavoprotein CzcO
MATACDVLVIGGSAAGLGVARVLEENGLAPVVLEAEPSVGVRWRSAYDRLHLHTPRDLSGLPCRPMPRSYPRYPSRQQVIDYLEDYAAGLKSPPLYGRRVTSIAREGEDWLIRTQAEAFRARQVVVATGNARVPMVPSIEGADRFSGERLHSSAYRNGEPWRGKRVLVVGFGNSAAEIALDLWEHGALPTVSVRGPVNVLPRDVFGVPVVRLRLLQKLFSPRVADTVAGPLLRWLVGDLRRLGLRYPSYGPAVEIEERHQTPVLDIGAVAMIRAGNIAVRPGIALLTQAGAVFTDGCEEPFAAVIFGTGYRARVGDFLSGIPDVLDAEGTPLVSGGPTAAPGLYFCGFHVAAGGQFAQISRESLALAGLIGRAGPPKVSPGAATALPLPPGASR